QLLEARKLATSCKQNINLVNAASLKMNMPPGTSLQFRLAIHEINVDGHQNLTWQGIPDMVSFPIKVPQGTQPGDTRGTVTVQSGDNVVGVIEFMVRIVTGNEKSPVPEPIPVGTPLAHR